MAKTMFSQPLPNTASIPARIVAVHADTPARKLSVRMTTAVARWHSIIGIRYGQYEPVPKRAWMTR